MSLSIPLKFSLIFGHMLFKAFLIEFFKQWLLSSKWELHKFVKKLKGWAKIGRKIGCWEIEYKDELAHRDRNWTLLNINKYTDN